MITMGIRIRTIIFVTWMNIPKASVMISTARPFSTRRQMRMGTRESGIIEWRSLAELTVTVNN